ncbi:MAG: undecaprenyl/decaprenyl-phosphate alpha-N-acetylglucosaminyl 1-phosphate transferase [Chitinophagaceae bacterium]|nr:undecaprenyl/decaprenyl-phosphate alpha-N-acetylglucosaminyl 1-phosphate transferase [Chitinophagaceae bacterium]
MNLSGYLLQIELPLLDFKNALISFVTAFTVTLISIPPIIALIRKYHLFDVPNERKEHQAPIPTMGGIAIFLGMLASLLLWFPFQYENAQVAFFFSVIILFGLGVMDDLRDLSAKYKFIIQIGLAFLVALAGIRITSLEGLLGIYEIPLFSQYFLTILGIVGITNAYNLIDGIDGLAGGLGFMSLMTLGLFLTIVGDSNTALIAFTMSGGLIAFLYFNFNPARIFMGDTGSLVLGFVVAVLSIRLLQVNQAALKPILDHAPSFVLGIVLIPVFDTIRVFATRIWHGKSPFVADRIHLHHLLTNQGFSHAFTTRTICFVHALILFEAYALNSWKQEWVIAISILFMIGVTFAFKRFGKWRTGNITVARREI